MSSSSSAQKAKATHDAAMSIIAKETEARAAKTERLRQLRLALEAQSGAVDRVALPRVKTAVSSGKVAPRAKRLRTKQAN
jgi:hypothetical protein